jgi:hypothetical protein
LFTSTMAMAPAYAERDDDDKDYDKDDNKRYDKGGDGNKQKVEDESAGSIADCDDNEFERATQNCIATAATDDSVVINGRDGDDDDDDDNGDNGNGVEGCDECIEAFLDAVFDDDTTPPARAAVEAELRAFGNCEDEFEVGDVEDLATALNLIPLIDLDAVEALEECLDALLENSVVV